MEGSNCTLERPYIEFGITGMQDECSNTELHPHPSITQTGECSHAMVSLLGENMGGFL